ncbi:MAG: hypothetical protein WAW79_04050 [Steroidobacteraceae bacterium]
MGTDGLGRKEQGRLKAPYRDGTTHIVLEQVDFMARLAARLKRVFGIEQPEHIISEIL